MTDDDTPADCAAFLAVVNAVLDGDAPAAGLRNGHARHCPDCRGMAAAARLLATAGPALTAPPVVPVELTKRFVAASTRARRRRWPAAVLAVCAVAGVWLTWPVAPKPEPAAVAVTAPRVADQLAALSSVARHAGEKASAPAKLFTVPTVTLAVADVTPPTEPAAAALAIFGQAARAGAEPVTGSARRAVGLFMRDLGLSAKPAS